MKRPADKKEEPVVIMRAGYATDELCERAIASAIEHGRVVRAIDGQGKASLVI